MAGGLLSTENCTVVTAQFIRPPRSAAEPGIVVSLTAPYRSALPNGIVSPVVRARVMAGRSTTKKRPTTRSESWGGKVNGPSPSVPFSHSVRPFCHEENGTCVLSVGHKRANQGRLYVLWATFAPVPSDARSRFRYQYLHLLLRHQERKAGETVFARFSAVDSVSGAESATIRSWPSGDALWRGMPCTA
jgi:hypothetical protein